MTADGRAIVGGADTPVRHRPQARRLLLARRGASRSGSSASCFPPSALRRGLAVGRHLRRDARMACRTSGPRAQFPHGYFALGYGGNGITFSWIAASILLDLFLGRPNPDAELFRFDRG